MAGLKPFAEVLEEEYEGILSDLMRDVNSQTWGPSRVVRSRPVQTPSLARRAERWVRRAVYRRREALARRLDPSFYADHSNCDDY